MYDICTKLSLAVLVALLLGSCAATGPAYTSVRELNAPLSPSTARLLFLREGTFRYSARPAPIKIDGIEVQSIPNGSFLYFDLKPGSHYISSEVFDWPGKFAINANLQPGHTFYVQVTPRSESMNVGGIFFGLIGSAVSASLADDKGLFALIPMAEEEAKIKLQTLKHAQ